MNATAKKKRRRNFGGLDTLPEIERMVLSGIATELLEIDPYLRVTFHKEPDWQEGDKRPVEMGFKITRRKIEFLKVTLRGIQISASYSWDGRVMPARPVPDKPGWVYPAHKVSDGGSWWSDIQDPEKFPKWLEQCVSYIKQRVGYLEDRRKKVVQQRQERQRNAEITAEAHARWRERWERVQADMYVI